MDTDQKPADEQEPKQDPTARAQELKDQIGRLLNELVAVGLEEEREADPEFDETHGAVINWVAAVEYQSLEDASIGTETTYAFRPKHQSRSATIGLFHQALRIS